MKSYVNVKWGVYKRLELGVCYQRGHLLRSQVGNKEKGDWNDTLKLPSIYNVH